MRSDTFLHKWGALLLAAVIILAAWLRFMHLDYQSLWFDELLSMQESNPSLTWGKMFLYLGRNEQHPPLFFVLERMVFFFFGYDEWMARSFTAWTGVLGVWAVYLLGKELQDARLGLIAAALTSVNYFNIYYSQEARDYILAFLFSTLSFLYFIRLVRNLRPRDAGLYLLFTVLMTYTHYYGLFIVCSQFVIAFILWFSEKERKKQWALTFGILGGLLLICYAPLIPAVKAASRIRSFWIKPVKPDFLIVYFRNYFGHAWTVIHLAEILLIFYIVRAILSFRGRSFLLSKSTPLSFSFLVICLSIFITLLLPYLRSVFVVPMLYDRYTIVILPLLLTAIAYGILLIPYRWGRYAVLAVFMCLSLKDMFISKKYYSSVHKTQFRELTAFIASDTGRYPLLNDRNAIQQEYYLKKFGFKGAVLEGRREDVIDSILERSSRVYDVKGFWLMDAHELNPGQPFLDTLTRRKLEASFALTKEIHLLDAWAKLYMRREESTALSVSAGLPRGSLQ